MEIASIKWRLTIRFIHLGSGEVNQEHRFLLRRRAECASGARMALSVWSRIPAGPLCTAIVEA